MYAHASEMSCFSSILVGGATLQKWVRLMGGEASAEVISMGRAGWNCVYSSQHCWDVTTKCVKVLRAKAKAESNDQSQARAGSERHLSEPVIGQCFLLLLSLVAL